MQRKYILFIIFGFLIFGCGSVKNIRVLSIGKPYISEVEELCRKQFGKQFDEMKDIYVKSCRAHYYFIDDGVLEAEGLKAKLIAVTAETNFSMIQNAGYVLRECLFEEEIIKNSKHGFDITAFTPESGSHKKGFFVLNINKFRKLNWLDKDNLLTKSICISPPFGSKHYKERKEIDAQALKNTIDIQEGQK